MNKLFVAIFMFSILICRSQDLGVIDGLNARHFKIINNSDTIEFVKTNSKIDSIKPVIIFCQGSNPIPLIINKNNTKFFATLSNFDYKKIALKYHLIIISMPHIPVEVNYNKVNSQYCYITDSTDQHSYPASYLTKNYSEKYIERTKAVIEYLYKQNWVNKKQVILFGHSQGSKIAVGAALFNPKVSHVGYASGNPIGRIDQLIREQRKLAKENKITREESQLQIESIYGMWSDICKNPNATTTEFGDPNRTWTSFSKPLIDDMLNLNKPLYVTYGTEDVTSMFCDLLPIYFIRANKNNLTLKPIIGVDHNFFEIDTNGNTDYKKGHWQDIIDDFIKWVK